VERWHRPNPYALASPAQALSFTPNHQNKKENWDNKKILHTNQGHPAQQRTGKICLVCLVPALTRRAWLIVQEISAEIHDVQYKENKPVAKKNAFVFERI